MMLSLLMMVIPGSYITLHNKLAANTSSPGKGVYFIVLKKTGERMVPTKFVNQ